jgi:hypothetical protein
MVRDEQPMRLKIFHLVAVFVVSWSSMVHGQDLSKPMDSAGFIYGQINFVAAFLGECADYDKKNAATYTRLFGQYSRENKELADRITTIMRTEQIRSGQSIETLEKMLFDSRRMAAETAAQMRRDDPKLFLNNCRAQPEVHKNGLAAYTPLHDLYPTQMLAIDGWK